MWLLRLPCRVLPEVENAGKSGSPDHRHLSANPAQQEPLAEPMFVLASPDS
jgi:hypothetical protein